MMSPMSSGWITRPVTNTVYKYIKELVSRKSKDGDSYIEYRELKYYISDRHPNISEEEIRKALLNLEIWGRIRVENNGNDLEIRIRKG